MLPKVSIMCAGGIGDRDEREESSRGCEAGPSEGCPQTAGLHLDRHGAVRA